MTPRQKRPVLHRLPISDFAAMQIAGAFRLSPCEVAFDACQLFLWAGPLDDLLAKLEERHGFAARTAVAYVVSLRNALRGTEELPRGC
jgi:hypothetical protein